MNLLDITSLGTTYRYAVKIEKKFRKNSERLDLQTPYSRSREKASPSHTARDQFEMASLRTTSPRHNTRREMRRGTRTRENGVITIKSLGTTLNNFAPSSHSWPN
jgi:hypothetical protein